MLLNSEQKHYGITVYASAQRHKLNILKFLVFKSLGLTVTKLIKLNIKVAFD